MKKLSTVAVCRMRRLQDQQLTIGLDLGDRSSFYCVLDGVGEVMVEERVTTSPEAMRKTFGKISRSRIALETGTHSPWVSRLLSELGHEAIVALISGEDMLNVALVDVSGKGTSAAILASTLQGMLHVQLEAGQPLDAIAAASNRYLCKKAVESYGAYRSHLKSKGSALSAYESVGWFCAV